MSFCLPKEVKNGQNLEGTQLYTQNNKKEELSGFIGISKNDGNI